MLFLLGKNNPHQITFLIVSLAQVQPLSSVNWQRSGRDTGLLLCLLLHSVHADWAEPLGGLTVSFVINTGKKGARQSCTVDSQGVPGEMRRNTALVRPLCISCVI